MEKHRKLEDEIVSCLQSPIISDLAVEYVEIGIDDTLSEGILKELPIVKTIFTIGKVGVSIRDRLFVKKILKFLSPLNPLPEELRQKMVQKLSVDPDYGRKVGEHLIELLDRMESYRKPEMIGAVFKAYAKGEIDGLMLHRLNNAIEHLPAHEMMQVRLFHEGRNPEERRELSLITLQALLNVGFANVISGYGALVYEPNEVCDAFVKLNIDRVSA